MRAIIDGDIVVYRCGFAAQTMNYILGHPETDEIYSMFGSAAAYKEYVAERGLQPDEFWVDTFVKEEPVENALSNVRNVLEAIEDQVGPIEGLYLSQGNCFRYDLATMKEYKGHRKDAAKPVHYDAIRQYMVDYHGATVFSSVEADDVLALRQDEDTVIVSIDKDLLQVPGRHYNWVQKKKLFVTQEVGNKVLMMQNLTGDNTDNIPGIYRVGEVSARALLSDWSSIEDMRREVDERWTKYIVDGKHLPVDDMDYDAREDHVTYTDWKGAECCKTIEEIVDEVYQLVKVGGSNALKASKRAGEEIPVARSA